MARKKKLYSDMSPDEREAAVRTLMQAGGSNKSVAQALGTTPGAIAGIRYRRNIPSSHRSGFVDVKKSESGVLLPRIPAVPGLLEAKSEASRCEYKGAHCPYEAKPGSPFCPLHQD